MIAPTTYAPELEPGAPPVFPTGNAWVALPDIRDDGAIYQCNAVHAGLSGLLAAAGDPLIGPVLVSAEGAARALPPGRVELLSNWVVRIHHDLAPGRVTTTILAPVGEQGFMAHLSSEGLPAEMRVGLRVRWAETRLQRFRDDPLDAIVGATYDTWTHCHVWEARAPLPLLALAMRISDADRELRAVSGLDVGPSAASMPEIDGQVFLLADGADPAGAGPAGTFFFGVARDADGARCTAVHLARIGFEPALERTRRYLDETCGTGLAARHLAYNLFFTAGDLVDAPGGALMTSRSPRYYVAGAFWARDALLWSFPAVLLADAGEARDRLVLALDRYSTAPGEHAQYLDGRVLYPGFELDEAAAFVWAAVHYARETGDHRLLGEPEVAKGLDRVVARIELERGDAGLYRTMLGPTDDPVHYPYLVYDNALLAVAWRDLARAHDRYRRLANRADALERAIWRHGVVAGPEGRMFGWAVDGNGSFQVHDEPAGSLALLGPLGFCVRSDPVYEATRRWIASRANPYRYRGRFAGEGSPHFPHPSCFSLANHLLAGDRDAALATLEHAPLDNGLACEGFDVETGIARTGAGFAACSGFLARALGHSD